MPNVFNIVHKFFPEVTKVVDATKRVTVEVTSQDAKSSAIKDHKACAMAVACKRAFKLDGIIVSRRIAYLIKDKVATRYDVPESVTREVVAFDRGGSFAAGEYELLKPSSKLGEHPVGGHNRKNLKNPFGKPRHITSGIRARLGGERSRNGR